MIDKLPTHHSGPVNICVDFFLFFYYHPNTSNLQLGQILQDRNIFRMNLRWKHGEVFVEYFGVLPYVCSFRDVGLSVFMHLLHFTTNSFGNRWMRCFATPEL